MTPPRRRSPNRLRQLATAGALGLLPLTGTLMVGCGGSPKEAPQVVAFSVELGETFSSDQLAAVEPRGGLRPWRDEPVASPTLLEPHRAPGPIDGSGSRDTAPAELQLAAPRAPAGRGTAAEPAWQDAWADWPSDSAPSGEAVDPPVAPRPVLDPAPEPLALEPVVDHRPARGPQVDARPVSRPSVERGPIPAGGPESSAPARVPQGPLFGPPAKAPAPPLPPTVDLQPAPLDPLAADTLLTESPAVREIGRLMVAPVREAFALGRSGAVYAAREKFEDALHRIADAKDAAAGDDRCLRALIDGRRALEEAKHFATQGGGAEGGLDVAAIARGHRTPVLHNLGDRRMLPQQAIARYHLHAAQRLAESVAGEQAGSMALFGLGKAYGRLADQSDDPLAARRSLAMYRAAILAHDGNHLAANELGVGLAKTGHYAAAWRALDRAAARGGGSAVYRNLAVVHQRLGRPRLAQAAGEQAERLAAHERSAGEFSRRLGVQWVSPHQFNRLAADTPAGAPAAGNGPASPGASPASTPATVVAASPRGPWRTAAALTRRAGASPSAPTPPAISPGRGNPVAPPAKSRTIVR